jgi:ubiquinone/menaquinone biosynthesis C-methylase UbiE
MHSSTNSSLPTIGGKNMMKSKTGPQFAIRHGALFDAFAHAYDRYRPGYPDAVIDDIISLSNLRPNSRLLEIGCGTGQATLLLAHRGYRIDCVDPGKNMIALAKNKCRPWPRVSFKPARFEEVELRSFSYDLVLSAQAFHWTEPAVRLRKAARLLNRKGSLALLYNYPGTPKDDLLEKLSSMIKRESGGLLSVWNYEDEVKGWIEEISGCGLFRDLRVYRHSWQQKYSAEEYAGLFRTYSDFLSLPKALQGRVTKCIRKVITRHGGSVSRPYDCVLLYAHKTQSE